MFEVIIFTICVLLIMSKLSPKNLLLPCLFFAFFCNAGLTSAQTSVDDIKKIRKDLKKKYDFERKRKEKEIKRQEKEYKAFLKQKKVAEKSRMEQLKREAKLTEEYKIKRIGNKKIK